MSVNVSSHRVSCELEILHWTYREIYQQVILVDVFKDTLLKMQLRVQAIHGLQVIALDLTMQGHRF